MNLIEVDFVDVTFSLIKGTFRPNKKPNNYLSYTDVFSNHPPSIIKRLPNSINDFLSRNSPIKEIFDNIREDYQKVLDNSRYESRLLYKETDSNNTNSRENNSKNSTSNKQKKLKIISFNPSYNKSVVTNVAKISLKLLNIFHKKPSCMKYSVATQLK